MNQPPQPNHPPPAGTPRPYHPPPRQRPPRSSILPIMIIGLITFVLIGLVGLVVLVLSFRGAKPVRVTANSVLHLAIEGSIPEFDSPGAFQVVMDTRILLLQDYIDLVRKAKTDPKIKGIFLKIGFTNLGWAQMQELGNALKDFKSSGKWIIALGELWQEREYFLATAADEIYMTPEGILMLDGLMARSSFYADLLDKYGIEVHVEAHGPYKSYGDGFSRNNMSQPHKQATQGLLDGINQAFLQAVHQSRNIEIDRLVEVLNQTVYEIPAAEELGLIDGIRYVHEIEALAAGKMDVAKAGQVRFLEAGDYYRAKSSFFFGSDQQIAVIYAVGAIQSGDGNRGLFGDAVVGSEAFISDLRDAAQDPNIKAIVVRIESPGGSQLASDVIWREIRRVSEQGTPVIASLGSVAASGGYYLAMACDEIVAQPTTITGSIGVVTMRWNLEQLYRDLLVNVEVVKTAPSADFFDPHRGLTEAELDAFRRRTLAAYQSFVNKAALSREMDYQQLETVAQGRVWNGQDALKHGLIDHLGGLDEAVSLAAERAGITHFEITRYPKEEDYWTLLREGRLTLVPSSRQKALGTLLPYELRFLADLATHPGPKDVHVLAILPNSLQID